MQKIIRRHRRKLLAVFGVGLMITFVANTGNGRQNRGGENAVIGRINGKAVYLAEVQSVRREMAALEQYTSPLLLAQLLAVRTSDNFSDTLGQQSASIARARADEILHKPELFYLLVKEARDAGVRVNDTEIEPIIREAFATKRPAEDDAEDALRAGLTDALLIRANFDRVASNVKISQPARQTQMAIGMQTIQLNLVEFPASEFAAATSQPTTQMVQEIFTKLAAVDPGKPSEENPFGLGYKLPQRVKVQYISINRDEIERAVTAQKSQYDWDVAARRYYYAHPEEFAAPSSQPTAAKSGASTPKPYDQARADALKHVMEQPIEKLMGDVQTKITAALSTGFQKYTASAGATGAALAASSAPSATSPSTVTPSADNYASYTYLVNLAAAVQKQFGVSVQVDDRSRDFLSQQDLAALPFIGQAMDDPRSQRPMDFAMIAMDRASSVLGGGSDRTPAKLLQPSTPLQDFRGNLYVFRLTDARPAEPASSIGDASFKVESDIRRASGYKMAVNAANTMLPAARANGFASAANDAKRILTTTNSFNARSASFGPAISIDDTSREPFLRQAFHLLSLYNPQTNPHPAALIELPLAGKVYVAQLNGVTSTWDEKTFFEDSLRITADSRSLLQLILQQQWFPYDAVALRTGYKPEGKTSTQ